MSESFKSWFERTGVFLLLLAVFVGWVPYFLTLWDEWRVNRENALLDLKFSEANYLEVDRVYVSDSETCQPMDTIYMEVSREIKTPFLGTYLVELRTFPEGAIVFPVATETLQYRPTNTKPDSITLSWWSGRQWDGLCIDPGRYQVRTTWLIDWDDPRSASSKGEVIHYSPPFTVWEEAPEKAIQQQEKLQTEVNELKKQLQLIER